MLTDAQLGEAAETMLDSAFVPAVPIESIRSRIRNNRNSQMVRPRRLALTAALLLLALPAIAFATVSYYVRSREALQAHGGWGPPLPSREFRSGLVPKPVTLAQARAAAGFPLIAPNGLPYGTRLLRIDMGPIGVYDRSTHKWSVGPEENIFRYRRGDGLAFNVIVERYDPRTIPVRYTFEDRGPDANGNPILVRHENTAWLDGKQLTFITSSNAIPTQDILKIMHAMDGRRLNLAWPNVHTFSTLRVMTP
jgi:hypothetical protein